LRPQRERRTERACLDLLGQLVRVVARVRTEHGAAADPLRGANRTLTRAAGALLAPRLLAAALHVLLRLGRMRAGPFGGALHLDDFPEQVLFDVGAQYAVAEVDGAALGPAQIHDVDLHVLISTSTPAERSSFISASSVCCVGSRMSSRRLCVRISN